MQIFTYWNHAGKPKVGYRYGVAIQRSEKNKPPRVVDFTNLKQVHFFGGEGIWSPTYAFRIKKLNMSTEDINIGEILHLHGVPLENVEARKDLMEAIEQIVSIVVDRCSQNAVAEDYYPDPPVYASGASLLRVNQPSIQNVKTFVKYD